MNTPPTTAPLQPTASSSAKHLFPTLTNAQIARIAAHGRRRRIARGEVLVDVGDSVVPFFVVVSGEIQVLRPSGATETLIVIHRPGQFSGEGNMITGRRALARLRVSEPGEAIEVGREQLLALVQTDAELSEILMRAFILRRVELIARGLDTAAVSSRNQPSRGLCGRRCAGRQHQARRFRRRRGVHRRRLRPSGASPVSLGFFIVSFEADGTTQ